MASTTSALTASISNLSILNERRNPSSFSRCNKVNPNRNPISLPTLSWSGKTPGRRTFLVYSLFGGMKENNDEAPAKLPTGLTTKSFEAPKRFQCSSSRNRPSRYGPQIKISNLFKTNNSVWVPKEFVPFAAYEETTETTEVEEEEEEETLTQETSESVDEVPVEDGIVDSEEVSVIMSSLQSYKEALTVGDESKVADIEAFLQSIEDEKEALAIKVATLSEELSSARDRTLRISADFDNFRKRTERERLSLVTNAQGEVVETMLPVLDNFERAKSQIKFETEGEEKINNSYQSIYKQFGEILESLGVVPVETVGTPFDPLLHEAIMREDSEEFEEGIILQEFRKGFKLGERLLRPSMVKVSAGPGPAKSVEELTPSEDVNGTPITIEEEEISSSEGESA